MDRFQQALAHAQATLSDIRAMPGDKPRATFASLRRLSAAVTPPAATGCSEPAGWSDLRTEILACTRCPHLVAFRHNVVFGTGDPRSPLMFVGEAPGADEDMAGEPFVGRAGQLLTKIIKCMGLERSDVFIANVLKCRPDMPPGQSGNRKPTVEEMADCLPWLETQIRMVSPKAIVALGATAALGLLGKSEPLRDIRGKWFDFHGIPAIVTYHPAYLLHNQSLSEKHKVWQDMLQVMERLGLPISKEQRNYFRSVST